MSTQENIEYIKKELSNEEKFLESLIKAEKFYKKYKKSFIVLGTLLVLAGIGYAGYETKRDYDLKVSNAAYTRLLAKRGTSDDLALLKSKNPKLYRLYLYHKALQQQDVKSLESLANSSSDPVIKDLALYHVAALERKVSLLDAYVKKGNILSDLALLDEAYLLDGKGEVKKAHHKLEGISKESPAAPYALLLRHYGVKQ